MEKEIIKSGLKQYILSLQTGHKMFNNTKGSLKKNIEIVNFFPIGGGGLTPKF